jgi:hypothetical protein
VLENGKSAPGLKLLPKQENHAHITKSNDFFNSLSHFRALAIGVGWH